MSEAQALNEAIFQAMAADTPEARKAADAICKYTHSLMYHTFTGMPRRSALSQLFLSVELHPLEYWERLGIPCSELHGPADCDGEQLYAWIFDGPLFYEIAEQRLSREDYERRLALRQVSRYEWEIRNEKIGPASDESDSRVVSVEREEQKAYQVMGELVALILGVCQRRRCDESGQQAGA